MVCPRTLAWIALLPIASGCASTVGANVADASAAPSFEAGGADGTVDIPADVTPDARVCPPIAEDDVPATDVPTTGAPHVVEVALGLLHQCARMSDGTVRCRGFNSYGALGLGTVTWRELDAVTVPGLTDVAQVVATVTDVTCTRHRDGTVRCWGSNRADMLGTGHDGDSSACEPNGACRPSPTPVPGLTGVTTLAAGSQAICAVRRDGTVWCWGRGDDLLPATGSATPVRITALSDVAALWPLLGGWLVHHRSGGYVAYGVGRGTVVGLTIPPAARIDAESGPAPVWHLCYRLGDGSVRCVGQNSRGQLGNGVMTTDKTFVVEPVDPGLCGVRSVASGTLGTCALMADRSVQCWGDGVTSPTPVAGLGGVEALFLGYLGRCALRVDHSVWCWGRWSPYAESRTPTRVEW